VTMIVVKLTSTTNGECERFGEINMYPPPTHNAGAMRKEHHCRTPALASGWSPPASVRHGYELRGNA
jgi:hypothetical protein